MPINERQGIHGRDVEATPEFEKTATKVRDELGVSNEVLNDYLRGVLMSLGCDAIGSGKRAGKNRDLLYIPREGNPHLTVYYTVDNGTCWLVALEIHSDWAAQHLRL